MSLIFLILFLVTYILFFILTFSLLELNFKNEMNINYSFKRYFSFESHNFKNSSLNIIYRTVYVIFSLSGIILFCYVLTKLDFNHDLDIYILLTGLFLIITSILKICLFFTKTLNIKLFLSLYSFRMLTLIISIFSVVLGLFLNKSRPCSIFDISNTTSNIFIGIFLIYILIIISSLLNPKFYNWAKMEKDENNNLIRPKVITLALYEWIFYLIEVLFIISINILFIICA